MPSLAPDVSVRPLTGAELIAAINDLAALRIAVFADWPYRYVGDPAYEAAYLEDFMAAPEAVLVAAFAGGRIVGAATALPMMAQAEAFRAPFEQHGIDPTRLFYFGESVLLPEWRGRGIGHAFFDHREARARACGAAATCFAAVVRAEDHPARPPGYVPLDGFWTRRGYAAVPGLVTELAWQEHGETEETVKPMQVWMREL